jgi:hypothetical protein
MPSHDSGEFRGGSRWWHGPMVRGGVKDAHELFGEGERHAGEKIWARCLLTLFIPCGG